MARCKLKWTLSGDELPGSADDGVRGLTREQLGVVFQPIVEVSTGRVFAFEALVRCKDARYPNPPALFEAAVKEEACGRLGRTIREVAFATCGDNALFVNLHPQELASRWLVKPDDPVAFHERPVYLEVTESAAFNHFDLCMDVLKEVCRRTGAHLVIDDFGAGYSNIERVADLEPAVVKLDLKISRDIHRRKTRQIVVRHVVAMCKELGAKVVAEGVETLDELRCLRDLGAEYVQGYLLARPAAPPPPHAWPLQAPAAATPPAPRRAPPPLPPLRPEVPAKPGPRRLDGSLAMPATRSTAPTEPPKQRTSASPLAVKRSDRAPPRGSKAPSRASKPIPRG